MPSSAPRYPIAIRLQGAPVLVVGGGPVAARKVLRLLRAGAQVSLVSPAVVEELHALADAGAVTWKARGFRAGDVAGQTLVFSATGDEETDRAVVMAARAVGTLVNSADQACPGDFELPALLERGALQVAVSTGGAAPGLAARLARDLEAAVPAWLGDYVSILAEARAALRARHPTDKKRRAAAFGRALASDEARAAVEAGDVPEARRVLWEAMGEEAPAG